MAFRNNQHNNSNNINNGSNNNNNNKDEDTSQLTTEVQFFMKEYQQYLFLIDRYQFIGDVLDSVNTLHLNRQNNLIISHCLSKLLVFFA